MTHLFSLIIAAALLGCAKSNTPSGGNEPVTPAPVEQTASAPLRTVHVSTASQLKAALLDARP